MQPPRIIEFMDVAEFSNYKDTGISIDVPLFQPFPSEVRFQRYTVGETVSVPLVLRNVDKVPRRIKVMPSTSPYFSIDPPEDANAKIVPGYETVYMVHFTPEVYQDYADEIVCLTEREKFVVPVRAVGSRAVLDFPDEVNFGTRFVKHDSTRILLVRNVGNRVYVNLYALWCLCHFHFFPPYSS